MTIDKIVRGCMVCQKTIEPVIEGFAKVSHGILSEKCAEQYSKEYLDGMEFTIKTDYKTCNDFYEITT